jgi:hypothetical protein
MLERRGQILRVDIAALLPLVVDKIYHRRLEAGETHVVG